jgi:Flp pilus assembly protein TadD
MRQLDWEGARTLCQAALQVQPTNARLVGYLGLCEFRLGRFDSAIVEFERATTLDPEHWEAGAKHAQALERLGRYSDAYHVARRWLRVNPNDRTLQGLALGLSPYAREEREEGWERTANLERPNVIFAREE